MIRTCTRHACSALKSAVSGTTTQTQQVRVSFFYIPILFCSCIKIRKTLKIVCLVIITESHLKVLVVSSGFIIVESATV